MESATQCTLKRRDRNGNPQLPFSLDCAGQVVAGLATLPLTGLAAVAVCRLGRGADHVSWPRLAAGVMASLALEAPAYVLARRHVAQARQRLDGWGVSGPVLISRPLATATAAAIVARRATPKVVLGGFAVGLLSAAAETAWMRPWADTMTQAERDAATAQLSEVVKEDLREYYANKAPRGAAPVG